MTEYIPPQQEGFDSSDILRGLRRRAWIVLLATILVAAGAYAISSRKPAQYKAQTSLLIGDSAVLDNLLNQGSAPAAPGNSDKEQQTRILQLKNPIVFQRTAQRLGGGPAVSALNQIVVGADKNSNLVYISAQATSPQAAALASSTFAREAVAYRRQTDQARILESEKLLQGQLRRLRTNQAPTGVSARVRRQQISQLQDQVQQLDTLAHVQTGNIQVVNPAQVPRVPISPRPKHDAAIGAFAGFLFGVLIALVVDQRDRRMRRSNELETAFGMPLLASVPPSRQLRGGPTKNGHTIAPAEAETFQMLRANLMHAGDTAGDLRSVLVTSPGASDGKSTVAFNLAAAAAVAGRRVLLIEADLRKPTLGKLLGLQPVNGGLSGLLVHNGNAGDVRQTVPVGPPPVNGNPPTSMDVVVAGPALGNPTQLLESKRMRQLIRAGEQEYDLVLIDSPPVTVVSDCLPLLAHVGGVVVVASMLSTTAEQAERLRKQLARMNARTLGVVANFASTDREPRYYGGYELIVRH